MRNDKSHSKEYRKQYRKDNLEKRKEYNKRYIQKNYGWINNYKLSKGCQICGYNKCARALEFHHPNDNKEFSIAKGIRRKSLKKIKEEIEKCIILCANCHREICEKINEGGDKIG